jgi:glycosyltransferase involved in cell wall biosynthesis
VQGPCGAEANVASVDVVIPVYNEEHVLEHSVETLRSFLRQHLPYHPRVLIADNASRDNTLAVARGLAARHEDVDCLHLPEKGRGRALRAAWLDSNADAVSYMDVDLSTDLAAFPPLIASILEEGYDIAIGTRLGAGALTTRSPRREFISRVYNFLIKAVFLTRFSDAQCGFKALSRQAAQELVPLVENQEWFFDTELLLLAEKGGYRVKEVPVRWVEDPDTRVRVVRTMMEDLRGLLRMRLRRLPRRPSGP